VYALFVSRTYELLGKYIEVEESLCCFEKCSVSSGDSTFGRPAMFQAALIKGIAE